MEKKISILLGWIKVPGQALDTINAYYTDIKVNKAVKNLHRRACLAPKVTHFRLLNASEKLRPLTDDLMPHI